jgi:hypothetical protein
MVQMRAHAMDNIEREFDPHVVEIFDKLLKPLMRTIIVEKLGLPDNQESPTAIDHMAFLISKSGLAADERADLAMQIGLLCQVLVQVPHEVQPRKARSVRSGNAAALRDAVDAICRGKFPKPPRRTANDIATQIMDEVNERLRLNGGRCYGHSSIRKAVSKCLDSWTTVQSSS